VERLDDAIESLIDFSLIKRNKSSEGHEKSLWMHPLVQLWVQGRLHDGKVVDKCDASAIFARSREGALGALRVVCSTLAGEFWDRMPNEWLYERRIMTHLEVCLGYVELYWDDISDSREAQLAAPMIFRLALVRAAWMRLDDAIALCRKSICLYNRISDPVEDVIIAKLGVERRMVNTIELIDSSKRREALEIIDQVINAQASILGENHCETIRSNCAKSALLVRVHREGEAVSILHDCLKRLKDSQYPAQYDLGTVYGILGNATSDMNQSLQYFLEAGRCFQSCFGKHYFQTIMFVGNAGGCLIGSGKLDAGLEILQLVRTRSEQVIGRCNDMYRWASQLAGTTFVELNRHEEALECFEKAIEVCVALRGPDDSSISRMTDKIKALRKQINLDGSTTGLSPFGWEDESLNSADTEEDSEDGITLAVAQQLIELVR